MKALRLNSARKILALAVTGWILSATIFSSAIFSSTVFAATPANPPAENRQPVIGIIIDDMGNLEHRDKRALRLPGPVTFSFLPHTPHARELAELAHQHNKEVMIHLPMESMQHDKLGPGALTLDMTAQQFSQQLTLGIAAIPHAVGLNNHMGSLLTQHPGHMQWLMTELSKRKDLYFVDSYTTKTSIAQQLANENWIPNMRRDVFLDHDRNPEKIRFQLQRLIKKARRNGTALAIGHPFPETIAVLKEELPKLRAQGITLLPVSQLVHRTLERSKSWQAYLSR